MDVTRVSTFRKMQADLNRLSLSTLGYLVASCEKDEVGNLFRLQCIMAMYPEFDSDRLSEAESVEFIKSNWK